MKTLLAVAAVMLLVGCATGPDRYESEWQAYTRYLNAELQAGRMTRPQAEYLAARKRNELINAKNFDDASYLNSLGTAAAIQNASNPVIVAPLPAQTVCQFRGDTMVCR